MWTRHRVNCYIFLGYFERICCGWAWEPPTFFPALLSALELNGHSTFILFYFCSRYSVLTDNNGNMSSPPRTPPSPLRNLTCPHCTLPISHLLPICYCDRCPHCQQVDITDCTCLAFDPTCPECGRYYNNCVCIATCPRCAAVIALPCQQGDCDCKRA